MVIRGEVRLILKRDFHLYIPSVADCKLTAQQVRNAEFCV